MNGPTRPHEVVEELLAADVLHGLDGGDRDALGRALAEHGPDCAECVRLRAEYGEVAAALAVALDPVPLSAGAEERLLQAVREEPGRGPAPAPGEDRKPAVLALRRRRGVGRWLGGVAVAASVVLLAGIFGLGYLAGSDGRGDAAALAAFVARSGVEIVAFPSRDGERLAVAYRPGESTGWLVGSAVADPPAERVYELWARPAGSERMEPAGTFRPEDGTVLEEVDVGADFDLLAVTVESGFRQQPTTAPIYVVEAA